MISTILTFYIFIVMSAIAKLHMYWLKGGLWPGKDKQDLVDKVIGKGNNLPSELAFVFVISCFALMGLFPLLVHYKVDMGINVYERYVFLFFSIIFFLRAISMFLPGIEKEANIKFVEYNKKYYTPLILSLSIAYFILFYLYN